MATEFVKVTSHKEFTEALNQILDKYALELGGQLMDVMEATAKDVKAEIRTLAEEAVNSSTGKKLGGQDYKKSWTYRMENRASLYKSKAIIHSKEPYYRLAHLLEYGHAKRNGGRVDGYPHLVKASDFAEMRLEMRIREALQDAK